MKASGITFKDVFFGKYRSAIFHNAIIVCNFLQKNCQKIRPMKKEKGIGHRPNSLEIEANYFAYSQVRNRRGVKKGTNYRINVKFTSFPDSGATSLIFA